MYDSDMEYIMAELKKMARDMNITILVPKAPPLTPQQQAEEDAWFANPYRFQDYIGLIR